MSDSDSKKNGDGPLPDLGGFIDGMANILGKLGELADKGQELKKCGEFGSSDGKSVAGSYGVSVRFGTAAAGSSGGRGGAGAANVTPLNKGSKPAAARTAKPAPDAREPHVDVFVESDHVLVVAEMPGVAEDKIELEFEGTQLRLVGRSERVLFEKHIELPQAFTADDVQVSVNNGVAEIRLATENG